MIATAFAVALLGLEPPKRYDYPARNVRVIVKSPAEVHSFCNVAAKVGPNRRIMACAFPLRNRCYIVWPKGMPRSGPLWRHENAHCNGWPAHHPA